MPFEMKPIDMTAVKMAVPEPVPGMHYTGLSTSTASIYTPWRWLESTRKLQEDSFGVNYDELKDEKLAEYVIWNHSAAVLELSEFMDEIGWKPWASPRGWVNREQAIGELIDVAHFLANLACALGVTDQEWEERYQAKQQVNRERQASGTYDARSTKCDCGRELDGIPEYFICICGKVHTKP